jgi:hypothetical protein
MALNADPKKSATTVHVSVITLYGIEKSGVGKFTTSESGPMFMPRGVQRATRRRGTQAGDAAHTRHTTPKPRAAAPRASAAEAERTIASTREPHRTPCQTRAKQIEWRIALQFRAAAQGAARRVVTARIGASASPHAAALLAALQRA